MFKGRVLPSLKWKPTFENSLCPKPRVKESLYTITNQWPTNTQTTNSLCYSSGSQESKLSLSGFRSRCWEDWSIPGTSEKMLFPWLFQRLMAACMPWLMWPSPYSKPEAWLLQISLPFQCFHRPMAFSVLVPFFCKNPCISWGPPGHSHVKIINSVVSRPLRAHRVLLLFTLLHSTVLCFLQTEGKALHQEKEDSRLYCDTCFITVVRNLTCNIAYICLFKINIFSLFCALECGHLWRINIQPIKAAK